MRNGRTSRESRASGRSPETPETAAHLHAAVDDAEDRLGGEGLRDRGRVARRARLGRVPSRRAVSSARVAAMSISLSATICWTMPRSPSREPKASRSRDVRDGDVVAAPGGAEPAHHVGHPGGAEPDLGVLEAAGRPRRARPRRARAGRRRTPRSARRSSRGPGCRCAGRPGCRGCRRARGTSSRRRVGPARRRCAP